MARPRTPTNVLEMRGAYNKNPQRKREDEPEVAESQAAYLHRHGLLFPGEAKWVPKS